MPAFKGIIIPHVKPNLRRDYSLAIIYKIPMARWSEPAFRTRVENRARALGLSLTELLDRAQVSSDVFRKPPKTYGRSIRTIEKIADACGWTLAQAIGVADPRRDEGNQVRIDSARIRLALLAADRTIGDNLVSGPERLAALADLAGYAYDLLSGWAASGSSLDESVSLDMIEVVLRQRFTNPDLPKS